MTLLGLQDDSLSILNSFNDHLWKRDIGELEFALVLLFLKANIECVDWAAERANADLGSITFPSHCRDGVVVLDLFAADLIPLRTLRIEVVDIKAVKVSYNCCLSGCVECGTCEFFHLFILRVVESLETVACLLIEMNLAVISTSKNMWAPGESVGYSCVLDLWLSLSLKIEAQYWGVKVSGADPLTVRRSGDRNDERIAAVDRLTFVCLQQSLFYLALR